MSTERSFVTSSGEFGPPEDGASWCTVPAPHASSSCNGLSSRCDAGHGEEFATANYYKEFPPLPRLRGGGEETGGGSKEDMEEQAGPSSPIYPPAKPGPRCSKGKERERAGRIRKEKDWRRILPSSEDEEEKKGGDKEEEDEEYLPESPAEILELSRTTREGARMKLRSVEEIIEPGKPRIVHVTTLEGSNRIRMKSPGMKRGREEKEEEMDMEEEYGTEDRDTESCHSSCDSSMSRSAKKRKRGRGRPPKDPLHKGLFTADKIRQRAKERELEKVKEKEQDILDPGVKATSKRAEAVDRHARMILEDLRELPTPELTEKALRVIEAIKKVASKSKNMSGAFVGVLWRSSEELTALSLAYSSRLRAWERKKTEGGESEELDRLRSELSSIRTEHALMGGENLRLREQVAKLRDRIVQGEAPAPPPKDPPSPSRRRRGKYRGSRKFISDSSSTDEMEEAMERELTREEREVGIKARKEVEEDLNRGTLPPAFRPPLKGRTRDLDVEMGEEGTPSHPLPMPRVRQPELPPAGAPAGLSQDDIVRLIQTTISQLLPQLGGGGIRPEGATAQQQLEPVKKDPPIISTATPPVRELAGDGQGGGGGKKRKRKGKKGRKGGVFPSKGAGPPRVLAPPLPPQRRSRSTRDPLPFPARKKGPPPPWIRRERLGGEQGSHRVPGKPGPW